MNHAQVLHLTAVQPVTGGVLGFALVFALASRDQKIATAKLCKLLVLLLGAKGLGTISDQPKNQLLSTWKAREGECWIC